MSELKQYLIIYVESLDKLDYNYIVHPIDGDITEITERTILQVLDHYPITTWAFAMQLTNKLPEDVFIFCKELM